MSEMTPEAFNEIAQEIRDAWNRATTRDAGFQVIVQYGQKYGYKNVIAAIQNRMPKRFTREKPLNEWVDERRKEESAT